MSYLRCQGALSRTQPHSHSGAVSLPALSTLANFFLFFHRPCQLSVFYNWEVVKLKWITRRAKLLSDGGNSWKEQPWSRSKFGRERYPPETLLVPTQCLPHAGSLSGDRDTEWVGRTLPEFFDLTFLGVDGDLGGDISASASSLWLGSSSHSSLTDRSAQTRRVRELWEGGKKLQTWNELAKNEVLSRQKPNKNVMLDISHWVIMITMFSLDLLILLSCVWPYV